MILSATKLGNMRVHEKRLALEPTLSSHWQFLTLLASFQLQWFTACMCVSSQKQSAEQRTKAAISSWWVWLGISWLCVEYLSHSFSFSVCDLTFLSCVHISDCNWNQGVAAGATSSLSSKTFHLFCIFFAFLHVINLCPAKGYSTFWEMSAGHSGTWLQFWGLINKKALRECATGVVFSVETSGRISGRQKNIEC